MKPIGLYLAVSFGFTWICWWLCWSISVHRLGGLDITQVLIAGSFGPFLAAGLCVGLDRGFIGILRFYGSGFDPRISVPVFAAAFLLMPCLAVLAAFIYHVQTGEALVLHMRWSEAPMAYLWLFVLGGPIAEEFGWSYLSDQLDERIAVIPATILLGTIWGFWHLPLFFLVIPGLLQHYMPFGLFVLLSIGSRFLFSWAYHKSGHRILSNLLFHNALNFALSVVTIVPPIEGGPHARLWYLTGLAFLSAFCLWRLSPPADQLAPSATK